MSDRYKQINEKGENLTGQTFGQWEVLGYLGNKLWECRCSCANHTIRSIKASYLRSGRTQSCGCKQNKGTTIIGKHYNDWEVIDKLPNGKYLCKCSCGTEHEINRSDLDNGKTKSCGHATTGFKDLTGKTFGEWKVLRYLEKSLYECECSCGEIRNIRGTDLVAQNSKSCGHSTNKLVNIQNKTFGEWKVIRHVGYGKWECRCSCGTVRVLRHTELLNGDTTSCGCKQGEKLKSTMLEKYGETCTIKLKSPRTSEQIDMVSSKESLRNIIETYFDSKPTIYKLSEILGIQHNRTIKIIHEFELEYAVDISPNISRLEKEVFEYLSTLIDSSKITQSNRLILEGKEIDIYIPEKKLAIEINGTYWHSSIFKQPKYHQEKSIGCAKQGIRLIHIFEYEWNNDVKRDIIKNILQSAICNNKSIVIQARKCRVTEVDSNESRDIINTNHLQGYINAEVTLALKDSNDKILGIMSFGKPRYSTEYEWELIRLVWNRNVRVIGGAEKLFKTFLAKYNPISIVSYCDISKFTGSVYLKLGFKTYVSDITRPNYVWVNTVDNKVLSRYQTQKHKLIANKLGNPEQTEAEIMDILGYMRIYDSGNLRFTWNRK